MTGGVDKVREMWGDRAARAAEIYIRRDCMGVVPRQQDAQMFSLFGKVERQGNEGNGGFSD